MRRIIRDSLGACGTAAFVLLAGCQGQRPSDTTGATTQAETTDARANAQAVAKAALNGAPDPKWGPADDAILAPIWTGDDDKGALYAPLWRGAFPGMEDYVYAPPDGDCRAMKSTVRVDWDSAANTVHFLVKGKNVDPHPTVHRTEGVDWWPNQFHDAPKDIEHGRYRLWLILGSTTKQANFWYDPHTLKLLGSDYDFPAGPPSGAIPVAFPTFSTTGSLMFDADEKGNLSHEYTLEYGSVKCEGGKFARSWATFCPQDLCEAAPMQPALSQLRPYVSPWQSPAIAPSWRDMLHSGVAFDLQVDDGDDPRLADYGGNEPYVFSGISYAGQFAALQGGVPNGWHMSILSAIQSVAPPIDQVPGGNGLACKPYVSEAHIHAPRYCEGAH